MPQRGRTKLVKLKDIGVNCGWPGCRECFHSRERPPGWLMLMVAHENRFVQGLRLVNPDDPEDYGDLPFGTFLMAPEDLDVDRVLCPRHVETLYAMLGGPDAR